MNDESKDQERDRELGAWLRLWEAPHVPARLDERMRASYRDRVRAPLWKGLLRARVSVPLPVAALLVALLLTAGGFAARNLFLKGRTEPALGAGSESRGTSGGLADLRPLAEIRMTIVKKGGLDGQP